MDRVYLTGVLELDWPVLVRANSADLRAACATNVAINMICQDERFWKERVEHWYPGPAQFKPHNISYRQQQEELDRTPPYSTLDRPDLLLAVIDKGGQINRDAVGLMITYGRLAVLQALYRVGYSFNQRDLELAASSGELPVVQWLISIGLQPTQDVIDDAVLSNNTELLDWLADQFGLLPGSDGLEHASRSCLIESLDWMEQRGIHPGQLEADDALDAGGTNVLYWLAE